MPDVPRLIADDVSPTLLGEIDGTTLRVPRGSEHTHR
jgi:hypothetical protein